MTDLSSSSQRLDKWLWCARIFKTRALAAAMITKKGARITRFGQTQRTDKPGFSVRAGDVVAIFKDKSVRILEIQDLAERRGPASEAQLLYTEHTSES